MRRRAAALLALSLFSGAHLLADDAPKKRPKIGIAFAGGGARGGAHVGVLKVLEELRIPVDYVAGTSIGSIVAGLYATGLSPDEMEKILRETNWDAAVMDDPPRPEIDYRKKYDDNLYLVKAELGFSKGKAVFPTGVLAGQKLGVLLRRSTLPFSEPCDFDRLPIPYRAVAADLETGNVVVLSKGDVARSMRASMAIAGFFSAVEIDGKLLTDGGAVRNLPVDVVRDMGADIVIAIDISTPLHPREKLTDLFAITNQTVGFLTRLNVLRSIETLKPRDILITPDLEGIQVTNFAQFPKAIPRGVEAAKNAAEALRALSVSEEEYAAFLKSQRRPRTTPVVDAVRLGETYGVDPEVVRHRIGYKPGGPVDWTTLGRTLDRIFELGDFETVDFRIVPEEGRSTLVIEPRPKRAAPTRVRFGLALNTDFSGASSFGLRVSVNRTHLNDLRGEWKTEVEVGNQNLIRTELYQPLDHAGRFFVEPAVGIERIPFNLYIDGSAIGRYLVGNVFAAVGGGISFGPYGQLSARLQKDWTRVTEDISAFPIGKVSSDRTALIAELHLDQLDNAAFPRSGYYLDSTFTTAGQILGGELSYNRLDLNAGFAKSLSEWTAVVAFTGVTKIGDNDLPFLDAAFAGGFLNLSGLKPLELWGNYSAVARLVLYRRVIQLPALVGSGVFVGGSIETGNAWLTSDEIRFDNLRFAGSLFVGADTLLGPLYFGFGIADGGSHSFYLSLGFPLS
ncbi:MAG: patatin-like phospholipase family protein [Thermoanaerobaculia bacterium]